jgi:TPR repeat protein
VKTCPTLTILFATLILATSSGCAEQSENAAAPSATASTQTEPPTRAEIADGLVEQLAEKFDPRTLYVVGNQYATGDGGVEKDQDIAERLWSVSCERGHAYACSIYGSRQIEHGNFEEAARTLTMAAEAGVMDAISNLIELHDSEAWPGASTEESVKWYEALQILQNQSDPTQSNL